MPFTRVWVLVLAMTLLAACTAPAPPAALPSSPGGATPQPAPTRTLRVGIRIEPPSIASKPFRSIGTRVDLAVRSFNAELSVADASGIPQPVLAEALPQLNTDSWRVFPDGRMETTHRLRAGLVYHDGTPLEAEDFVFAARVFATPELGLSAALPQSNFEEIRATDSRTLVVRWTRPFADAATLDLPPLPRHLLAEAFERGDAAAFAGLPFWTREYVHLGPYRMTRWEPGAFIEGEAFDRFVFGRPKIDRIHVRFIGDANAALAGLLSDDVQILTDFAVTLEQVRIVKRDWVPEGKGNYVLQADSFRQAMFQHRPELAMPRSLLDVRVRKAIAHAFDRQGMNDAIYDGAGVIVESLLPPNHPYGPLAEPATIKYPYDLRQAERLMSEAGLVRTGDGAYSHPVEGRFAPELRTNASSQNEAEVQVLADAWRKGGFAFTEAITPTALVSDNEFRATTSGLYIFSGGASGGLDSLLRTYNIDSIARPETRWSGGNRGGWANEEYSRLVPTYDATLDQGERARIAAQLVRIFTDQLPAIPMAFNASVTIFGAKLRGPAPVAFATQVPWNLHTWEISS
jgi:peptide/nickel transport system substrate-binding protein